jgi:hypothetical protein
MGAVETAQSRRSHPPRVCLRSAKERKTVQFAGRQCARQRQHDVARPVVVVVVVAVAVVLAVVVVVVVVVPLLPATVMMRQAGPVVRCS